MYKELKPMKLLCIFNQIYLHFWSPYTLCESSPFRINGFKLPEIKQRDCYIWFVGMFATRCRFLKRGDGVRHCWFSRHTTTGYTPPVREHVRLCRVYIARVNIL